MRVKHESLIFVMEKSYPVILKALEQGVKYVQSYT